MTTWLQEPRSSSGPVARRTVARSVHASRSRVSVKSLTVRREAEHVGAEIADLAVPEARTDVEGPELEAVGADERRRAVDVDAVLDRQRRLVDDDVPAEVDGGA